MRGRPTRLKCQTDTREIKGISSDGDALTNEVGALKCIKGRTTLGILNSIVYAIPLENPSVHLPPNRV